jgi:uncharacterized metal-binding protein YceD (DUF177 family)
MSSHSFYNIAFKGLSQGKHIFEYEIDSNFLSGFEGEVVDNGKVNVRITLEKQSSMLILWFDIDGTVTVQCDRCLEMFDLPIHSQEKIFVKFGEKEYVDGDDVIWVSVNDYQLNVAQLIYEFICLAVPIKKVHPDGEDGKSTCDPLMIEKLNIYITKEDEIKNPVWNDLKKLLDNE